MASQQLSPLSDPVALAKLQILVIPVQPSARDSTARLSETVYSHWSSLIKRHQSIRGDEIRPTTSSSSAHQRGSSTSARARFLPASSATSVSRANTNQHVHLAFPSHPPARHLYPLNLLRLASFPLVVIGITVDGDDGSEATPKGYSVAEEDEDSGDVGGSTPTTSSFSRLPTGNEGASQRGAFEEAVAGLFPQDSAFPLIKRLVVVPRDLPKSPNPNPSPRKGGRGTTRQQKGKGREEVRYAPGEAAEAWIGGLIGEIVGDVLGELGELVTALETPTGLKTLSSTLLPSLTSTASQSQFSDMFPNRSATPHDMPSRSGTSTPTLTHSQSNDTLSGAMGITLNRALTPGGRPTSVQPTSIQPIAPTIAPEPKPAASNPTRRFSSIPSPFARTSSAASTTSSVSAGGAQSPAIATRYTSASLTGVAGGRLMKVLGDVYLLVGMYGDAIKCYDDGAERCRVTGDVLWEAMAREGRAVAGIGEAWETRDGSDRSQPFSSSPIPVEIVAHYLSALSCLARAPLPYPPTILSPAPHSLSGTLALPPPPSSSPTHIGTGEGLLAYLYTSLSLRIAHFHLIIWSAGGWGSIALSCLVSHTFPRTFPPPLDEAALRDPYARTRRHRFFSLLGARSGLTRISILGHGEGAIGPYHRAMTKMEQLAVHTEVVWLARWMDLPRHEAIYGREVVKRLGALVVEGRAESRRMAKAGFSHSVNNGNGETAAVGLGFGLPTPAKDVVVRRRETSEGNTAIMTLIERVLGIINIDLITPLPSSTTPSNSKSVKRARHGDDDAKHPARFGWPEIQVDTLQSLVAVAESIADQDMVVRLALSALRSLGGYLHQGSQAHLLRLIGAATGTMKRRGRWRGGVEWWVPGKVVLSLEVAALPANRFPVEHAASEIVTQGKKDPFLYNPRIKAVEAGKTVIVANEQIDVFITLSNPFAFDLEVADLALITSGVQFLANPLPLVLPANSVQTVRVTGVAPSAGSLFIQGISIRLPDGASTQVYLPVVDDKARVKKEKRRSRATGEMGKMKRSGMEARYGLRNEVVDGTEGGDEVEEGGRLEEGERWLECKVVRELPLLWVKRSNLAHGTVMLYNGEMTTLRLTLENSSSTPVNFLKLSFDDNTLREARSLLNEELAPREVYEVEWDMIKRPVFTYEGGVAAEVDIPPGGRYTVSVKCLGKVGCTDGSIRIDYGYIDHSLTRQGVVDSFHTRQITFPVLFTVYHTLELHDLEILRFPSSSTPAKVFIPNGDASTSESRLRAALESEADGEHCLVALVVRNVYGVPFEVTLTRRPGEEDEASEGGLQSRRLVPPGASERLFLPFPRISLPPSQTSPPIPSLTSRQYIIDKTGRTPLQVKKDRELFWFREHLLSRLTVDWSEPGSAHGQGQKRQGVLSMRNQDLGWGMMDALRVEQVCVVVRVGEGEVVKAGEFVPVGVTVENRLDHSLKCQVRLEPVSPSDQSHHQTHHRSQSVTAPAAPARNVIFDGVLSSTLPTLATGESGSHGVSAIFLAEGSFAFRAVVLELPVAGDKGTEENPYQGRIWASDTVKVLVS